jgi:hypothetical protein
MEVGGNNRSVMPLDVLGRTRATLTGATSVAPGLERPGQSSNAGRDGDRFLQFLIFNEEFLVNASHQLALITSLPFVHTARRTYRLDGPVKSPDRCGSSGSAPGS